MWEANHCLFCPHALIQTLLWCKFRRFAVFVCCGIGGKSQTEQALPQTRLTYKWVIYMSTHRVYIQSSSFLPRWSQGPARDYTQAIERLLRTEESEFPIALPPLRVADWDLTLNTPRVSVHILIRSFSQVNWVILVYVQPIRSNGGVTDRWLEPTCP